MLRTLKNFEKICYPPAYSNRMNFVYLLIQTEKIGVVDFEILSRNFVYCMKCMFAVALNHGRLQGLLLSIP